MNSQTNIKWLTEPEDKNYPAAASYLNLLYDETTVNTLVSKLNWTLELQQCLPTLSVGRSTTI